MIVYGVLAAVLFEMTMHYAILHWLVVWAEITQFGDRR